VKALVIEPSGEVRTVDLPAGDNDRLTAVKELVGGWVEVVAVPPGAHAYVNEEGRIYGLADNPVASRLAGVALVGPAVVLGNRVGSSGDHDVPAWVQRRIEE